MRHTEIRKVKRLKVGRPKREVRKMNEKRLKEIRKEKGR